MSVLSVPNDLNHPQRPGLPPSSNPRQMSIPLESIETIGLSESARSEILAHLANLLLLAAGVAAAGEEADER
jgi:hypothetical protein